MPKPLLTYLNYYMYIELLKLVHSGVLDCNNSKSPIRMIATYSRRDAILELGHNALGQRVCQGSSCRDLGFSVQGHGGAIAGGQCLCGGSHMNACYYMD